MNFRPKILDKLEKKMDKISKFLDNWTLDIGLDKIIQIQIQNPKILYSDVCES